jgi:hypothetical protein
MRHNCDTEMVYKCYPHQKKSSLGWCSNILHHPDTNIDSSFHIISWTLSLGWYLWVEVIASLFTLLLTPSLFSEHNCETLWVRWLIGALGTSKALCSLDWCDNIILHSESHLWVDVIAASTLLPTSWQFSFHALWIINGCVPCLVGHSWVLM